MKIKKTEWDYFEDRENKTLAVIMEKNSAVNDVYVSATRLTVEKLKVLFKWKFGKFPPAGTSNQNLLAAWIDVNNKQP